MIKNFESKFITLFENDKPLVKFDFGNFPILGIWSIPGAPYICIEPWFNYADRVTETGMFKDKDGVMLLESGNEFICNYSLEF